MDKYEWMLDQAENRLLTRGGDGDEASGTAFVAESDEAAARSRSFRKLAAGGPCGSCGNCRKKDCGSCAVCREDPDRALYLPLDYACVQKVKYRCIRASRPVRIVQCLELLLTTTASLFVDC